MKSKHTRAILFVSCLLVAAILYFLHAHFSGNTFSMPNRPSRVYVLLSSLEDLREQARSTGSWPHNFTPPRSNIAYHRPPDGTNDDNWIILQVTTASSDYAGNYYSEGITVAGEWIHLPASPSAALKSRYEDFIVEMAARLHLPCPDFVRNW